MATKKFTTGELNLMRELGVDPEHAWDPDTTVERSNRFTGAVFSMNKVTAKLHDIFYQMMNQYEMGLKVNVAKMDRVKYLVLKLNSDAYMGLID